MPNAKASKNSSVTEGISVGLIPEECNLLSKKDFHASVHLTLLDACALCTKARN